MAEQITLPDSLTRHLKPRADIEIIRDAAEDITQALGRLHRADFKFTIGSDCSFVLGRSDDLRFWDSPGVANRIQR